ncbi:hypothetical protein M0R72_03030 [Candidatus Pacearchaeota archaeon]|jgi:predicted metal-dependent HD superfamily phosphohydrolase|nr:hypothetical protein [Candidatus Pacearchaeota archaeon]
MALWFHDSVYRILASPPTRFEEYEAQIRMEYREVPDEVFYPVRRRIMKSFAEKEHTSTTRQRSEGYLKAGQKPTCPSMLGLCELL